MTPIQANIESEPYAVIKWYSVTLTFVSEQTAKETEEEYEANIAVSEDENTNARILEIIFPDDLPDHVDEEEIKKLIEDEFNKSDN